MEFNKAGGNGNGVSVHGKTRPNGIKNRVRILEKAARCGVPGKL
jgi:hypothetical protein